MKKKNGRFKKTLSMILCGVLCAMSFAISDLGSVKAYATEPEPVDNPHFVLELPDKPVCGENISDHNFKDYQVEVKSHTNCTAKIADAWNTSDEKFVGGKEYQVKVEITANEGYFFPNNWSSSIVTVSAANDNGRSGFCQLGKYLNPDDDGGYDKRRSSIFVWANFTCEGNPITVSFNGGTGSGNMSPVDKKEGDPYHFPECEFIPQPGYKFIGWSVNDPNPASGKYLYKADEGPIVLYENTTLYAQYAPKDNYALTINCDPYQGKIYVMDGSGYELNPNEIPEGTYIRLKAAPTSGWTLGDLTNWQYQIEPLPESNSEYLNLKMPASSMKVGYTFEKDPDAKTITLDPKGGSVTPSFVMTNKAGKLYLPDEHTPIDLPTPTKSGYIFKYWAKEDGTEYDKNETYTSDSTLYAVYEIAPTQDPEDGHVHNFEWQTISEPSKDADGLEGEVCSCGAIRNTQPISAFGYALNVYATQLINSAKAGQTVTFEFGEWNSFPTSFMNKIASRRDVTFVFHYKWNHISREIIIPAGAPIDLNFDWYGPAKMAELYGAYR